MDSVSKKSSVCDSFVIVEFQLQRKQLVNLEKGEVIRWKDECSVEDGVFFYLVDEGDGGCW